MLIDKWKPLYAPEQEAGVEPPAEGTPPQVPMNEQPVDGPGSGRSKVRKQLEDATKAQQAPAKPEKRDRDTGRYTSRARREQAEEEAEVQAEGEQPAEAAPQEGQEGEEAAAPDVAAPDAWSREAKEAWADLPPHVQEAVVKREQDVAKGVAQLQSKYKEIDQAIAPRLETLKRTGHTPAQAVNQLFLWFEALTADSQRIKNGQPAQAFPALAQSFGIDLAQLAPPVQGQAQPPAQAAQQPQPGATTAGQQPEVPEAMQRWIQEQFGQFNTALTQKFGTIEQQLAAQNQAKTQEVLGFWSKDKPYYEDVRVMMAQMLSSGAVPPLPNGNADLDKAYDMALYALPEVRARVLADQQKAADTARKAKEAAEKKAQQEQANKARRAAVALGPSAPGENIPGQKRKPGKTVRDSLKEAMEEVGGR